MTQPRLVVRRTRNIRDIYLRKRYITVAVYPGGREIIIAKSETRRRAFVAAVATAGVQTSPTAIAYDGGGATYGIDDWNRAVLQQY